MGNLGEHCYPGINSTISFILSLFSQLFLFFLRGWGGGRTACISSRDQSFYKNKMILNFSSFSSYLRRAGITGTGQDLRLNLGSTFLAY